jgi:carbonic anhydrase
MKMQRTSVIVLVATLACSAQSMAAGNAHWTYAGQEGSEHWGGLDKSYAICASGMNQSPVNLTKMIEGELPELKVSYEIAGQEILNNGHTIQVNYAAGSTLTVENRTFELKQFHFHTPSENTIEGQSYPMEAHFVHGDENGNLAVIAVLFKTGKHSAGLEKAWAHMPESAGIKQQLSNLVDANSLLPGNHAYYRFNGSLTTPPCSEGVNWFVMKDFATASQEQINKFSQTMQHPNNRPVQPINAREIIQ